MDHRTDRRSLTTRDRGNSMSQSELAQAAIRHLDQRIKEQRRAGTIVKTDTKGPHPVTWTEAKK